MGKLLEMKSKPVPRTDLAAEVLPKLAAAKAKLAELEAQAAAAMLSSTLGEQGATAKLAQINAELDTAQRSAKPLTIWLCSEMLRPLRLPMHKDGEFSSPR
jgi:hypothetical protein